MFGDAAMYAIMKTDLVTGKQDLVKLAGDEVFVINSKPEVTKWINTLYANTPESASFKGVPYPISVQDQI